VVTIYEAALMYFEFISRYWYVENIIMHIIYYYYAICNLEGDLLAWVSAC
jgi:hypothetical protein